MANFNTGLTKTQINQALSNALSCPTEEFVEFAIGAAVGSERLARQTADTKMMNALAFMIDNQLKKNLLSVNSGTTTAGNGYFCENLVIDMPEGTYHIQFTRDTAGEATFVVKDSSNNEVARKSYASGVTELSEDVTLTGDGTKISIYVGNNVTVSDAMVCPKEYYDISDKYVPYNGT